jgi:hypothetical protein
VTLVNPDGGALLSEEEKKAQLDELVEAATSEGLKRLLQVSNLQEAQKLWLSGGITSEQFTTFLLLWIAMDVRALRGVVTSLGIQVMPRPGGGIQ